ncbi:hypothetical protein LX64_04331 [Chitinophaga skermanii]|uniref:Uncharacterized protein n=1 Tax=Chitinophaga skermanii TaxID=331697 RepID=A0A327Q5Q7_9BACT|nr:hypothetical protein [Chitinophaga skermanii]RAI99778.1 hypothetical protein LX64_04331 [Chitinophaga skermanii]
MQKYLVCGYCHDKNLLSNESSVTVFCNGCGKRLPFNYEDVKVQYPSMTYQQYLDSCPAVQAVPSSQSTATQNNSAVDTLLTDFASKPMPTRSKEEKPKSYALLGVLLIIVIIGGVCFKIFYLDKQASKATTIVTTGETQTTSNGTLSKSDGDRITFTDDAIIVTPKELVEKEEKEKLAQQQQPAKAQLLNGWEYYESNYIGFQVPNKVTPAPRNEYPPINSKHFSFEPFRTEAVNGNLQFDHVVFELRPGETKTNDWAKVILADYDKTGGHGRGDESSKRLQRFSDLKEGYEGYYTIDQMPLGTGEEEIVYFQAVIGNGQHYDFFQVKYNQKVAVAKEYATRIINSRSIKYTK